MQQNTNTSRQEAAIYRKNQKRKADEFSQSLFEMEQMAEKKLKIEQAQLKMEQERLKLFQDMEQAKIQSLREFKQIESEHETNMNKILEARNEILVKQKEIKEEIRKVDEKIVITTTTTTVNPVVAPAPEILPPVPEPVAEENGPDFPPPYTMVTVENHYKLLEDVTNYNLKRKILADAGKVARDRYKVTALPFKISEGVFDVNQYDWEAVPALRLAITDAKTRIMQPPPPLPANANTIHNFFRAV